MDGLPIREREEIEALLLYLHGKEVTPELATWAESFLSSINMEPGQCDILAEFNTTLPPEATSASRGPIPPVAQPTPEAAIPGFPQNVPMSALPGGVRAPPATLVPRSAKWSSWPELCRSLKDVLIQQNIYGGQSGVLASEVCSALPFIKVLPNGSRQVGIKAADFYPALKGNVTIQKAETAGLYKAEEEVDLGGAEKISHRLEIIVFNAHWQLEAVSYDRQVSGRKACSTLTNLSRAAVVWHAAKTVRNFMEGRGVLALASGAHVAFNDLIMFGLLRVSQGSFQILLGHQQVLHNL